MKRRTTENENHTFQRNLYNRINAFDLQGLTMNSNRDEFTAGVEYFDLDYSEYQQLKQDPSLIYSQQFCGMLPNELIKAQAVFTNQLGVPLYYIWGYGDDFLLHEIYFERERLVYKHWWINTEQLISFWYKRKQTIQTHPFDKNGAKTRAGQTRIDGILEAAGLEWGGNIDGFIIKNNRVIAIIDCISIGPRSQTTTHDLTNPKADPRLYFNARGPKYATWLSTIMLARTMQVPHELFTLNKVDMSQETIGLTGIDFLTTKGINYYLGITPNNNVLYGLDTIEKAIFKLLNNLNIPRVL